MLDSKGHINTDILNPPQIERQLEEKAAAQFSRGAAASTRAAAGSPDDELESRSFQKYLAERAQSKVVKPKALAPTTAKPSTVVTKKSAEVVNPFTPRVPTSSLIGNSKAALALTQDMSLSPTEGSPKIVPPSKETARSIASSRSLPTTVVTSRSHSYQGFTQVDQKPAFDLPITYNSKVKFWVAFFQGPGQKDFRRYLERSSRYLPKIFSILDEKGLPRDLAYVAMIESGFSSRAVSTASAVGYWQFIAATANRYGLKTNWWLDERRDITKSTVAAAQYLNDLYRMFDSWYLAAAAYNMGEGRVKKLVKKYQTRNYWVLSQKPEFPHETVNYIPKLMAALLIAKAPAMYGFSGLNQQQPHEYEFFEVPGGTDLENLAYYTGINIEEMRSLNPELVKGFVPQFVSSHRIRLPKGRLAKATEFIRASL